MPDLVANRAPRVTQRPGASDCGDWRTSWARQRPLVAGKWCLAVLSAVPMPKKIDMEAPPLPSGLLSAKMPKTLKTRILAPPPSAMAAHGLTHSPAQASTAKSPGRSAGSTIDTSGGTEADGCFKKKTPKRTYQASRGEPSSGHHRPLQPTPPRRQLMNCIPKPRSQHRSLPHHGPGAY